MLTCVVCGCQFERSGSRGPVPLRCGQKCVTKSKRTPRRIKYEREYRRTRRARGLDLTDNKSRRDYFRERWRRLFGDRYADLVVPSPYTGHKWFDMARQAVNGGRDVDPMFRDYGYNDEVGEAVLALLEGRSMAEAIREFRSKEFVPRHLTVFTSEWHDDETKQHLEDSRMPTAPSAEEEVMASFAVMARYHHGRNDRPTNNSRKSRTQPSRRRMKDKSLRSHRRVA